MSLCRNDIRQAVLAGLALLAAVAPVTAQARPAVDCDAVRAADHATMDHATHQALMEACEKSAIPTQPGQAAFGLIGEVVRMLSADPATDWTRVSLEALRQHLIDMDEVTMRAVVSQRPVAGGFTAEVTGGPVTAAAIQRMLTNHGRMLDLSPQYRLVVETLPDGVRWTVTAGDPTDARAVARVRGLGVAGLLTEGEHHAPHHLAIARGDDHPHGHP